MSVATDPVGIGDDLEAVVARARREAEESGELASEGGGAGVGLDPDVRDFILSILRDGTYAEAVSELARRDPDLATQ